MPRYPLFQANKKVFKKEKTMGEVKNKQITILKKRLFSQRRNLKSLVQNNRDLVTELHHTKMSLSEMNKAHNKLLSRNYELSLQVNHCQVSLSKLKSTMDSNIPIALQALGSASEQLLHVLNVTSKTRVDSNVSTRISDSRKNLATVSPMVGGYVISNPTIPLQRFPINPDEIYCLTNGNKFSTNNEYQLSSIPEEHTGETLQARSQLGTRTQNQPIIEGSSFSIADNIPEEHLHPVVRLSDVSTLLNGTSCRGELLSLNKLNSLESSRFSSLQPNDTFSLDQTTSNLQTSINVCQVDLLTSSSTILMNDNCASEQPRSSSSFVVNDECASVQPRSSLSLRANDDGCLLHTQRSSLTLQANNHRCSLNRCSSSSLLMNNDKCSLVQPKSSLTLQANDNSCSLNVRRSSSLLMNDSTMMDTLPSTFAPISEFSTVTMRKKKEVSNKSKNKKKSLVRATSSSQPNDISEPTLPLRSSSRARKPVKYLTEPLTSKEMRKIMIKGLKKKNT